MVTFTAKIESKDPVMDLVMCMLHSVTNAHILHFKTRSFSEHMALGTFYNEIGELVDSFVESFQGKYGLLTKYTSDFMLAESPIPYLEYLKAEVETNRRAANFPQDSELQNEIDNIANLINSTLYKLRFLK